MNRLFLYISVLIAAFLVSCAQQSESAAMEADEAGELEMVEESISETSYYWEDEISLSTHEEDKHVVVLEEPSHEEVNQVVESTEDVSLVGNVAEKDANGILPKNEQKLMKAFVKQNIENLLDLGELYQDDANSEEMIASVKSEMMQVLGNGDFNSFQESLFFDPSKNKKISLLQLEKSEHDDYVGVVQINAITGMNKVAFKVSTSETAYGTSRKFEILGIAY